MSRLTASIVGGSGYTGGELLRLLLAHPNIDVTQVTSRSLAGKLVTTTHPNLRKRTTLKYVAPDTLERVCETFAEYPSCGALLGVWTSSPDVQARGISEGIVSRTGLFQLAGTCVQFYRKEAVAGIRFDPLLGPGTGLPYGCGEDTDYLLVVSARAEVRRYAKIRVFHPSPKENQPSPQKVASYAAGRMYLLKKHGFSRLFMLFNVLYPLCIAPLDALRYGKAQGIYRLRMFFERLRNWF